MKVGRDVTHTSRVLEQLREVDDFMSLEQLRDRTGLQMNQVSAALHNLRRNHVVDVVVEPDGRGWWFARPAKDDTRVRVIAEIKQGITRRRRPRKS